MGYFEGLLGGFVDRKYGVEEENRRQSEQAAAREQAIFTHLLSADDPETRSMALAGLLDSANPRRKAKGLRGWVGETMASPYLEQIRNLQKVPVTETQTETKATLPSTQMQSGMPLQGAVQPAITEPPPEPSAGMPPTSPVQPGGPPPTPISYTQAPPTPYSLQRTSQRPREAFLSPVDKYMQEQIAKNQAEPQGMKAGLVAAGVPDLEATEVVKQSLLRRARGTTGIQHINVELPDGSQRIAAWDSARGLAFDPDTGGQLYGAMPLQRTASATMGVAIEPLARAMYGKRGVELSQAEMAQVMEAGKLQKSELTIKDAIAAAQRFLPNATIDQQMALADALKSGTAAPVAAGGPPAPAAVASPASGTPGVVSPPAPGGPASPAGGPTAPPKPGALSTVVPPNLGAGSKETGKPMPPELALAMARSQGMQDTIDKALAALEPYKNDTTLKGSVQLAEKYRGGTAGEADLGALVAQVSDLAGLQSSASAQLGGTGRAQRIYADKRLHAPRVPSFRQIQLAKGVGATGANYLSGLTGDPNMFDSPAEMYQKLVGLKSVNQAFIDDAMKASRTDLNPIQAPASSAPGTAYKDAAGVWHIRQ